MIKRYLLLMVIIFTNFSCFNNSKKIASNTIEYVEINDTELIRNVREYYSKNLNDVNIDLALILIERNDEESNVIDELFFELNLYGIMDDLPPYYSIIDSKVIFIKTKSPRFRIKSKDNLDILLRDVYSTQYDYYNRYGEFPPPITFSCEKWKFVNNKLIEKEFY